MNDCNEDLNQTDDPLRDEVSDEALEAASVALQGLPTLLHNTYCFACPSLPKRIYGQFMIVISRVPPPSEGTVNVSLLRWHALGDDGLRQ
jgi:hypothetical protein